MARPGFDPNTTTMQDAKTGEIPEDFREGIITDFQKTSAFMLLATEEKITKPVTVFTKMLGIGAFWVDEAQRIETQKPTFQQVTMRTKKLGVIIPCTNELLDYSVKDFFGHMRNAIPQAFAKKFDAACFAGIENPFAQDIMSSATALGNVIPETANKYDDINKAMGLIEDGADLDPNGIASLRKQKEKYRGTKDGNGMPIFNQPTKGEPAHVCGLPMAYLPKDAFGDSDILECVGNWNYALYGILRRIEYKVLDQATLTTIEADDAPGQPVNLAERDMFALRGIMEVGMLLMRPEAFAVVATPPQGP